MLESPTAEMEKEGTEAILTVVKKTSADMKERTGVEASMNEGEMKDYLELVIKELRSK